mmetsp:Transcript_168067/g.539700  ORF Transcript_168067/g.539700 Transcript_168067/m.539700 type:complete len:295 (-) Transcript_168067:1743-2627(-)
MLPQAALLGGLPPELFLGTHARLEVLLSSAELALVQRPLLRDLPLDFVKLLLQGRLGGAELVAALAGLFAVSSFGVFEMPLRRTKLGLELGEVVLRRLLQPLLLPRRVHPRSAELVPHLAGLGALRVGSLLGVHGDESGTLRRALRGRGVLLCAHDGVRGGLILLAHPELHRAQGRVRGLGLGLEAEGLALCIARPPPSVCGRFGSGKLDAIGTVLLAQRIRKLLSLCFQSRTLFPALQQILGDLCAQPQVSPCTFCLESGMHRLFGRGLGSGDAGAGRRIPLPLVSRVELGGG